MSRKRLKADNAEQLAEIIKAIQRGEEPTQESIRRNTESAPQADSPMSGSEEGDTERLGFAEEDGDGFVIHWPSLKNGTGAAATKKTYGKTEQIEPPEEPFVQEEELQDEEEDDEEDWEGFSPKEFVQDVTDRAQGFLNFIQRKKVPAEGKRDAAGAKDTEQDAAGKQNPAQESLTEDETKRYVPRNVLTTDRTEAQSGNSESAAQQRAFAGVFSQNSDPEKKVQKEEKVGIAGDSADGQKEDSRKAAGDDQTEERSENDWSDPNENSWDEEESEEFGLGLLGRKRVRLTDTMEENERFRPSKWGLRKSEQSDKTDDLEADEAMSAAQDEVKSENILRAGNVSEEKEESEKSTEWESDDAKDGAESETDSAKTKKSRFGGLFARLSVKGKASKKEDALKSEEILESEETSESAETEKQPEAESTLKAEDEAEKSAVKSNEEAEDFNQRQKLEKLLESGRSAEMQELPGEEEKPTNRALPDEKQERRIGSLKESEQESEEEQEKDTEKEKLPQFPKTGDDKKVGMNFLNRLREHGIGGREIGMLVIGMVLAVLIVVLVGKTITGMIEDSNKSENVTADKGLKVLVEEEPTSWSNAYPVKLKFKVSGASITEIRIDGTVCTADDQGIVTYEANNGQLEAEVDTDKSETLKASIEIPMLDGEAPVVHAARKQDQIELTATDARSTVTGIYYAAVDDTAMMNLPEYQKYSGPIAYTESTTYYFYAEDAAGNCSVPVSTNMETAKKLVLEQESIHLYPGGNTELMAEAEPSGALLDNLQYESLNPEILSVSKSGTVTALGEGTGSIKVSADGVEDVVCTVTVSDTKTVTISTLGDCTLGTDSNFSTVNSFNAYDEANGHDYFFKNVKTILEEDDVTFANLEGTFTTSNDRQDKQYAFKGDPDYTEILTDGSVEVVTLANNHSGDYGEQGLTDTEAALKEARIDYCIGDTITVKEVNGVKIAFIGIFVNYGTDDSENQLRSDIENAKKQGAELIITAFHWGSEKATQPDETQRSLAHTAIDCGADLVVGHHPHVLQGIEKYNGKYIAYSLGNFCFGGNSNPSDMDTMIFRQTFTISSDGAADDDDVTVIPCSISSEQGYNNYQPTPAEGEAAASIIAQLNEYSAAYGVTVADDGSVKSDAA